MLEITVVIAGDGARADVRACTNLRVSQIAQVIGFGPCAQHRFLDFHEIADSGPRLQNGAGAKARERPHVATGSDPCSLQVRKGVDRRAVGDRNAGAEHDVWADRNVAAENGIVTEKYGVGSA